MILQNKWTHRQRSVSILSRQLVLLMTWSGYFSYWHKHLHSFCPLGGGLSKILKCITSALRTQPMPSFIYLCQVINTSQWLQSSFGCTLKKKQRMNKLRFFSVVLALKFGLQALKKSITMCARNFQHTNSILIFNNASMDMEIWIRSLQLSTLSRVKGLIERVFQKPTVI